MADSQAKFKFQIADTVVIKDKKAAGWYYSSKLGAIKTKEDPEALKITNIVRFFIAKSTTSRFSNDEPAATTYTY